MYCNALHCTIPYLILDYRMLFHVTFRMRKTCSCWSCSHSFSRAHIGWQDKCKHCTHHLAECMICCNDEARIDAVIDGSIQQTKLCIIALALVSTRQSDSNEHTHSTQMTCSLISRSTSFSISTSTSTATATANDSMEVFHFLRTFAILLFRCVVCGVVLSIWWDCLL